MSRVKPLILFDPFGIENEYNDRTFFKYQGDLHWTLKKHFEQRGFEVHTTDYQDFLNAEFIVFFGYPGDNRFYQKFIAHGLTDKLVLYLFEPPVVDPAAYLRQHHQEFNKIFSYITTLPDGVKYFRYFFPQPDFPVQAPQSIPFDQKKFLVLMNGNKSAHPGFSVAQKDSANDLFQGVTELYSERRRFIRFAEKNLPKDFDFYGPGWDRPIQSWKKVFQRGYQLYRGTVENKKATLANYKFVLCYENANGLPGYITEKIFDCFRAATVPIYWGANDIENYIPNNCFIDRRKFKSNDELLGFLRSVTPSEYDNYVESAGKFLTSEEIQKWTNQSFAKNLSRVLLPNT